MKKLLSLFLSVVMLLSCFAFQAAFAADDIKVTINGQNLTMDQPPVLVSDRTLVPVRAIFEALGAKVDWNNDTNTATGVLGSTTVEIQIENTTAKVNGSAVTLDVPAKLINDRTLVPVRFISESLGAKVDWNDANQTVVITTNTTDTNKPDENKPAVSGDVLFEMNFDDMSSLQIGKDIIGGAAYDAKQAIISSEVDHTTGSGKSIKMANRTLSDHRIKFKDAFNGAVKGSTYVISAWVYAPEAAEKVCLGAYGDVGTSTAFSPAASKVISNIPEKTWTKIDFEYTYDNEEVTQVGLDQRPASAKLAPTLYIDDIKVELKK